MRHKNKSGIDILIKESKNTPRSAVCFYFGIEKPEKYAGLYGLYAKLLLQGTTTKNAKTLAKELENNCIDVSIKAKQDYFKISFVFLNEDFKLAMDYARDIMLNSTFDEIDKEIYKMKGEIKADLDNPRLLASDTFIQNLFKGHYYSNTCAKVLNEIDNATKEDVLAIKEQLLGAKKVISFAGDIKDIDLEEYFAQNFDFMKSEEEKNLIEPYGDLNFEEDTKIIKIQKPKLNQAQVFQGWIVDGVKSIMYSKISLMNNILGASGLSSRLFVELRDKQGLAYTVRSSYETLRQASVFSFYIATEPKNIKKSLDGFKFELERLANCPPDEKELTGGKENILGRVEYFSQTNSQTASAEGYNFLMGLGLNYNEKFAKMINEVTADDVSEAARYILNKKSLVCALADEKFLNF